MTSITVAKQKGPKAGDLASALAFALRFRGRKRVHNADELMSEIVAKRLVEHLERAGFAVMNQVHPVALPELEVTDGLVRNKNAVRRRGKHGERRGGGAIGEIRVGHRGRTSNVQSRQFPRPVLLARLD